jgi:hypothetical protein
VSRRYLLFAVLFSAVLSGVASWTVLEPVDETAGWRIVRVAVSGSGRWIAVGAASGWVGIIDQTQPESAQRFRGGAGELRDLRFSRDEKWLIVANDSLARHAVQSLGSLELLSPGDDAGVAQVEPAAAGLEPRTSNLAAGPGDVVVFGNAAGSVEVHDRRRGAVVRRFTFR